MSNWKNWYESFLENKRISELKAFAAGLNGEKYEVKIEPKFDSTSSWSELLSVVRNSNKFDDLNFVYEYGDIKSENKFINVCLEKARKINASYHNDRVLNYFIFYYLKSFTIPDAQSFIKVIREIPYEAFLECKNCGYLNESGWSNCMECKIDVENSYDLYFS
jgi:hypothetical protein